MISIRNVNLAPQLLLLTIFEFPFLGTLLKLCLNFCLQVQLTKYLAIKLCSKNLHFVDCSRLFYKGGHTGCLNSICAKINHLLGHQKSTSHKNGINTFMRCGHLCLVHQFARYLWSIICTSL